jgi:hypothetical protein
MRFRPANVTLSVLSGTPSTNQQRMLRRCRCAMRSIAAQDVRTMGHEDGGAIDEDARYALQ